MRNLDPSAQASDSKASPDTTVAERCGDAGAMISAYGKKTWLQGAPHIPYNMIALRRVRQLRNVE